MYNYMLNLPEQTIITPLQDSQPDTPLSTVEYPQDSDYILTPMDIKCTNAHEKVDEMCTEAREALKQMEPEELGSWERAVTVADGDGAWMTRGHHSKNFTFSIRNYFTGELLFRKHLCQKGGVNKDDLYKGTSKGAEGYAARILFQQAKEQMK